MHKTLSLALLALTLTAGTAAAVDIGIGAFGGLNVPIVNDLSEQGSVFGLRVPVRVAPLLIVEPFYSSSALGDVEETFETSNTYTRDGGDETAFGANALFAFGQPSFYFFPFAGICSYKIERDASDEIRHVGYSFGFGIGFSPIPKLGLNLRGEFDMIMTGDTSQKFGKVTAGASYSLFSL